MGRESAIIVCPRGTNWLVMVVTQKCPYPANKPLPNFAYCQECDASALLSGKYAYLPDQDTVLTSSIESEDYKHPTSV